MATVTVKCVLELDGGAVIADMSTDIAEGTTFSELKTSTTYATSAQSLGVFGDGRTITRVILPACAPNGMGAAYINRNGAIAALIPVAVEGQIFHDGGDLAGFRLRAGDTLQVAPQTAAQRKAYLAVKTRQGTCALFASTPSGAGNNDMVHVLTNQTFGESLVNQTVMMHSLTSVDGSKLSTGGVLYLSDRALPIGGVNATNPANQQPSYSMSGGGFVVGLNNVARLQTAS
ncbi:MAG: hypothetical protein ACPGGE_00550 [Poseidonia sp.]